MRLEGWGGPAGLGFTRDRTINAQVGYSRLAVFETRCFAALLTMRSELP
jgi:hypothetical protein